MIKIHLENKIANDASLRLRKGLIADVKTSDMANGKGVRTTVFVNLSKEAGVLKVDSKYIYD